MAKIEILFELKKHLPNYMIPSAIIYKPNLPKTSQSSGKIDKELLRKEFLEIA